MRAILFFVLIPHFGIIGAATATALSSLFMAAALRHATKLLIGIDASITRLIPFDRAQRPSPV
jgi:O-antigen/teichoic acid export membrane protein